MCENCLGNIGLESLVGGDHKSGGGSGVWWHRRSIRGGACSRDEAMLLCSGSSAETSPVEHCSSPILKLQEIGQVAVLHILTGRV